nr:hypothetical protein [Flavobacterium sp. ASV13]
MDRQKVTEQAKKSIKNWILEIDKTEKVPLDIIALGFNMYEPYGIELVGAKWFDEENEDWACEEDYEPEQRECPDFTMPSDLKWEEVLKIVTTILQELNIELSNTQIFQRKHIATGFVDGNLVVIK